MDYVKQRLSDMEALGIANTLLEVFKSMYHAISMKLTTTALEGQQVRIYNLDNIYEINWKNRMFRITLYSSPEECGYYSVLPDYRELDYTFCIIQEKRRFGPTKYEMCFGFDSQKRIFLELFDIDFHELNGMIFESGDSVETRLQGRIIF